MKHGFKFQKRLSVVAALVAATTTVAVAQSEFPFEREMLLDASPMPGSKRVPILEILPDGRGIVDLWCRSGEAVVQVDGDAIKFTLGAMPDGNCTPEQTQRDDELTSALSAVTNWRIEDDAVTFIGPTELKYFLSSH